MKSSIVLHWRSLLLLLLLSTLTACPAQSPIVHSSPSALSVQISDTKPPCKIIKHAWGETQLCKTPQRIIALDPHALDLLLAFDIQPIGYAEDGRALVGSPELGKTIAGVKYLGDRLKHPPVHIGTWESPSLETMLRLQPDLILGGYLDQTQYNNAAQIAPTLIPIDDWTSPKQWQDHLRLLGQVLDQEEKAQQVIEAYNQNVGVTKAKFTQLNGHKVLLLSMTGLDYIGIFNNETFAGAILEDLGFELVIPDRLTAQYGEIVISLETLPQLNPDLIIVMASGNSRVDQVKQVWESNPVLRSLPAYQNQQVYFVDYQLWSRIQGPIAAELVIDQVKELLLTKHRG